MSLSSISALTCWATCFDRTGHRQVAFIKYAEVMTLIQCIYCRKTLNIVIILMMEAARTSETSFDNYFTRQYIRENNSELYKENVCNFFRQILLAQSSQE
jgi:predicted metal-binding protein